MSINIPMLALIVGAVVFLTVFLRSKDREQDGGPAVTTLTRAIFLAAGSMLAVFTIAAVAVSG